MRFINVDSWTLLFWRGMGLFAVLGAVALVRSGWGILPYIRHAGLLGLGIGVLFGAGHVAFVIAVNTTHPANVLVILSATPLVAALFSRWLLRERLSPAAYLAILAVMVGITITLVGDGFRPGLGTLEGNLLALLVPVSSGLAFTLLRKSGLPDLWSLQAVAGLFIIVVCALVAPPGPVPMPEVGPLILSTAVVVPLAFALITLAPRYIPAAEVSLFMRLETVLGPLFVWLLVGIAPTWQALVGGIMVLTALSLYLRLVWRREIRHLAT